jgi:hypothetical protein
MRKFLHDRRSFLHKRKPKRSGGSKKLLEDILIVIESGEKNEIRGLKENKAMLYWQIGKRIREEFQLIKDTERKNKILQTLSQKLTSKYGQCFNRKSLKKMIKFGTLFSDARTASLLAHDLTWEHFIELMPIRNPIKRNFYAEMCRMESWSPEELQDNIDGMLFEKTAGISEITSNEKASKLLLALKGGESSSLNEFIYDDSNPLYDL